MKHTKEKILKFLNRLEVVGFEKYDKDFKGISAGQFVFNLAAPADTLTAKNIVGVEVEIAEMYADALEGLNPEGIKELIEAAKYVDLVGEEGIPRLQSALEKVKA